MDLDLRSGIATFVIAAGSYFIVPDWPQTARFLSEDERRIVMHRLALDTPDSSMNHWNKKAAKRIFGDVKIWLG